jgi:DivIVA domain-containing protein
MELSPKAITGVQFRTVRKGYDPEEVRSFLAQLARGVEAVQAQATATESRARSMMAKLQELSAREDPDPGEAMKRTLLLAQRTADAAIAEANEEARALVANAEEKARTALAEAQAKGEQLVTDAEADARRAGSAEKARIDAEVTALKARRDELHAEATRIEGLIAAQRERIVTVAATLTKTIQEPTGLISSPLAPPSPDPDVDPRAGETVAEAGVGEVADRATIDPQSPLAWSSDLPSHVGRAREADDDAAVADELAVLAGPPTRRFDGGGPPTAEVPVISADDELVRGFFEPEPFTDDRWKGRRTD